MTYTLFMLTEKKWTLYPSRVTGNIKHSLSLLSVQVTEVTVDLIIAEFCVQYCRY